MQKVLYLQQNGRVAVVCSAGSIQQAIDAVPVGLSHLVVNNEDLPSKEDLLDFFDALTADFGNLEKPNVRIDLDTAKELTKERLRRERINLFDKNDITLRDAMLAGDKTKIAEAISERDRLRNVTSLVDGIRTLDGLRKLHP